jgi:signal recognition particle receptor subunit beta
MKPAPIRVALHGFSNANEAGQIMMLFSRAHHWQQPWQVVGNTEDAQFLIVAADNPENPESWYGYESRFTRNHVIAYSARPFERAYWHLRRLPDKQAPSPLEFTLLLKEIGQRLPMLAKPDAQPVPRPVADAVKGGFDGRERLKILIVGSIGSGKSTAVQTLTGGNAISTEAAPSDHTQLHKKSTTVAMDFGHIQINEDTQLHIYGAPGQRRFDFMAEILIRRALGIIILVSNEFSDPLTELNYYLDTHKVFLTHNKAVIGVTHNDLCPTPSLSEYTAFIKARGEAWPVLKVDARKKEDMMKLVDALLAMVLA